MRSANRLLSPPGPTLGVPEIISAARVEAVRLGKLKKWQFAFRGAAPDPPLLVSRLDLPGTYYFVVGFRIGARLTGRLTVDAHSGRYDEATGVTTSDEALSRFVNPEDVWRRLLAPSRRSGPSPPLPAASAVLEPTLVWRPSLQSRSPFLPFHLVRGGKAVRYYRVDGEEFDDLFLAAGT